MKAFIHKGFRHAPNMCIYKGGFLAPSGGRKGAPCKARGDCGGVVYADRVNDVCDRLEIKAPNNSN